MPIRSIDAIDFDGHISISTPVKVIWMLWKLRVHCFCHASFCGEVQVFQHAPRVSCW